jgi:hypothetical protein
MGGANYGDPFYDGLASSISGTVGSGNCSWGGGGDDTSADNVFEQLLASLVASSREATLQVPMQQQHEKRKKQGDASANKKRKTKDEDYEASYQQLFHEEVVPKLRTLSDLKADTIVKTNKLHKQHRLALLFVKFGIFHRDNNSISANDVKKLLRAELTKEANQSWSIDLSSNTSADP